MDYNPPIEVALKVKQWPKHVLAARSVILYTHRKISYTFEAMKHRVDQYYIFDNRNGLELIASDESVFDKERYDQFLKKAGSRYRPDQMKVFLPSGGETSESMEEAVDFILL